MSLPKAFRRPLLAATAALSLAAAASGTEAAAESISVSPTRLVVPPAIQQTAMTVRAEGAANSVVQVRVYAWVEGTPADQLYETRAVVVSPPITELGARQELTVRIVRTATQAVQGHECYRVLVDRLPDGLQWQQQVALRIRHSVPLCFTS